MKKINTADIKFSLVNFHGKYYLCLYLNSSHLTETLKTINHDEIKSTIRNFLIFSQTPIFIHVETYFFVAPRAMFALQNTPLSPNKK